MANFDKFANLSPHGWNRSSATQTIVVGQNAHIGLWGGGPGGVDLTVESADSTICVAHEETRPTHWPHWRHFLLTALRDGETKINAFLPGTKNSWASMTVKVGGHVDVRLVFFPGERSEHSETVGTIYVIGAGGESMKAAGGPPTGFTIPNQGGHTVEPTPPGSYVLGPRIHVTTPGWPMSVIPWGATLRVNSAGEVDYEKSPGTWRVATGSHGDVTAAWTAFESRSGLHPVLTNTISKVRRVFIDSRTGKLWNNTWEKNDFGRWGWNLLRNGHATPYYIHTTPEDENASAQGKAIFLANSHGCIHLIPAERDRLMKLGYLKQGVHLEVRPYSESGPP